MLEGLDEVIPSAMRESVDIFNVAAIGQAYKARATEDEPYKGIGVLGSNFGILMLNPQAEDIHHFAELQLHEGRRQSSPQAPHRPQSRNEQIATDMRLFVRDAIDEILVGLRAWAEALIESGRAIGRCR